MKLVKLEYLIKLLLGVFLFFLPWQVIWIYQERFLNGIKWEYGTLGFYATELLLWVVILLFIFWYWKRARERLNKFGFKFSLDRLFIFSLLLLLIYSTISFFWSADQSLALQQSTRLVGASLLFLILWLGPLDFIYSAKWFVAGTVLPSMLGIWQFITQSSFSSKWLGLSAHPAWQAGSSVVSSFDVGRWLRAYGPFAHPNILGGYLVIGIVITILLFIKMKNRGNSTEAILFFVLALQTTALFTSFSRSALLALLVWMLLGILFFGKKLRSVFRSKYVLYFVLLIAILSAIFSPLLRTRVLADSPNEARSVEERVGGVRLSWEVFKDNKWLGTGSGNYTLAMYEMDSSRPGWEYQPVHNVDILFLSEYGIVGAVLSLLVCLSFLLLIFSISNYSRLTTILFSLFLLLPIAVLAVFDHYLLSSYVGLVLSAAYFGFLVRFSTHLLHN